jgi:hypothetical protein
MILYARTQNITDRLAIRKAQEPMMNIVTIIRLDVLCNAVAFAHTAPTTP